MDKFINFCSDQVSVLSQSAMRMCGSDNVPPDVFAEERGTDTSISGINDANKQLINYYNYYDENLENDDLDYLKADRNALFKISSLVIINLFVSFYMVYINI